MLYGSCKGDLRAAKVRPNLQTAGFFREKGSSCNIFWQTVIPLRPQLIILPMQQVIATKYNFTFWVHLILTLFSWTLPFFVPWPLALAAYATVLLQFVFFNRCLMNGGHNLDDSENDHTFYAYLLELLGIKLDRRKVKRFVRFWKYILLASFTVLWQVILGNTPLFW